MKNAKFGMRNSKTRFVVARPVRRNTMKGGFIGLVLLVFVVSFYKIPATFSVTQKTITSSSTVVLDLDTKSQLTSKLKFTPAQISTIDELLAEAKKNNLPIDVLIKRIKEGIAKKVDYQSVYRVITKKVSVFTQADRLIKERIARGNLTKKDVKYEVQLLAELLERGLLEEDFADLAEVSRLLKLSLTETVSRAQLLVILEEKEVSRTIAKEVVLGTMKKKFDQARKLVKLLIDAEAQNVSIESSKNIILDGVSKNRNYQWIQEKVMCGTREAVREEIRKEVIKEQEREQRK